MGWADKYWDTVDQFYWDPSLLGLASIPKAELQHGNGVISIPEDRVRNGGSIYTRKGTAAENAERMRRLEEPLNHIFDITFGIAPDEAIQKFFLAPLGFDDPGPFLRLGREIATRYSGFANSNTTQQDAFYVGKQSLVGVELKLGSKTWPGQALKYLALMVAEEKLTGRRDQIGLLYITPESEALATFDQLGATPPGRLPDNFIAKVRPNQINKMLSRMIERDKRHFDDAAARLVLRHQSWQTVATVAQEIADEQNIADPGRQTLANLMLGFAAAVSAHSGCV